MTTLKTAKLFPNGGSQAVRLPAEFRFGGADEVFIRRDAATGEVILSAKPVGGAWTEFFALRNQALIPADFMKDLPLQDATSTPDPREGR
jgi:antitoxin VapB